MAEPWDYASTVYLNLTARLADGSLSTLKIDRYLNAGLKKEKRTLDSDREKDGLFGAVKDELKINTRMPVQFPIGDRTINTSDLQRVFTGKGSPDSIRTAVWLASRYKRIDNTTVADYCKRN